MPRIAVDLAAATPVMAEPVEPDRVVSEVATPVTANRAVTAVDAIATKAVEPEVETDALTPTVVAGAAPEAVVSAIEPARPRPARRQHRPAPPKKAEPPKDSAEPTEAKPSEPAPVAAAPAAAGAPAPSALTVQPQPAGPPPDYLALLVARLNRYKEYPRNARIRRVEGRVLLWFALDREGRVIAHRIARSSGYDILDHAVETMIQRAAPLPPLPESITGPRLELVVPVDFSLR